MADSNITKRALAAALKELMETESFAQVSVGDICEKCQMNRKSFYYHFKDKYDLVNWIYFTEFLSTARLHGNREGWALLEDLCSYFYENRKFYRKILSIEGQNSFASYFREILTLILSRDMEKIFGGDEALDFYVDFFADAFVCAIRRWLSQRDCLSAKEFSRRLKRCLVKTSCQIVQDFAADPR